MREALEANLGSRREREARGQAKGAEDSLRLDLSWESPILGPRIQVARKREAAERTEDIPRTPCEAE